MARYRPLSVEVDAPTTAGTAITVSSANVVRVVNTAASTPYLVSLVNDSDVTVASMTLNGSDTVLIDKPKNWKVFAANAAVKLSSVSYPG